MYTGIYIYIVNSFPGLQSAGVLDHFCLRLQTSNGRDQRCLRPLGPQDHLHSRPPEIDDHIILKTHLYICVYI